MSATGPKDISALSPDIVAYTNGPILLAKTSTIYAMAMLTVSLRIYSRQFIVKSLGKDDWAMLSALVFATVCFVSYVYQVSLGVGKYVAVIQADEGNYRQILRARQIHMIAVVIGISLAKISICFFLLRLTVSRLCSYFLWSIIVFTACFAIACTGTLIFQCTPVAAAWDVRLRAPPFGTGNATCFSREAFRTIGLFNGVVNILTDFLLALLPIPLIWTLPMTIRSRLSLIVILGLGIFAALAGIMRQMSLARTFADEEPWIHDSYAIWNFIELDTGIIAASLPATKPLLSRLYDTAINLSKGTKVMTSENKGANVRRARPSNAYMSDMGPYTAGQTARVDAQLVGIANKDAWDSELATSSNDSVLPTHESTGKSQDLDRVVC
ncbi:hypothetical protein M3J07_013292 [Ascochyta lentis]